jgi:hypothetical protein
MVQVNIKMIIIMYRHYSDIIMYTTLQCKVRHYNVKACKGITTIINKGDCNTGVTMEQVPFAISTSLPRVQCR